MFVRVRHAVLARPYLAGGAALALALIGWSLSRGDERRLETMVLAQSDFAAIVAVSGTVVAPNEVDLGFAQSGRVAGVYAKVGSRVAAGTVLANVENGDERAALASARARLEEALAGTRPEELRLAQADVASAEAAALETVRDAYRAADDAVRTQTAPLFNNPRTRPTLTFITERTSAKRAAEDGRRALESALLDWEDEVAALSASSDPAAPLLRAQEVLGMVSPFLSAVASALNDATADAYSTQAEIDAYITGIASARASISAVLSDLSAARSALESARRSLALAEAGSTSYDIAYQRAQVEAAQSALAKTIIAAPFSGIVSRLDVGVGEIVSPNTPQISMLGEGTYQIESYVPEVSISALQAGDTAAVTLDAYGDERFEAAVVSIDPAETVRDGVSTYKTTLQFSAQDPRIRSGLTANIEVATEMRPDAIAAPLGAVVRRGSEAYVQILRDGHVTERQVVLGVSSIGMVELAAGVSAGEVLVLNPAP